MDFDRLELLVLDVDGVLSSGRLQYDSHGPATREFYVHDGCAIKLWHRSGGRSAILSGRESESVTQRAAELAIETVVQRSGDKLAAFRRIVSDLGVTPDRVCYVGDDLPDVPPMRECGWPVAVYNAVHDVKRQAQYVTRRPGGAGAVAEVVELILRKQRKWDPAAVCTG